MTKLQQLKEQKEKIHNDMVALKDGLAEGEAFTEEQIKKWDGLDAEMTAVDSAIATEERLLSLVTPEPDANPGRNFNPRMVHPRGPPADPANALRGWALTQAGGAAVLTPEMESARGEQNWDEPLIGNIRWDQTKGSDVAGGHSVPDAVIGGVVKRMKRFGGMLRACHVFTTTDGNAIRKPKRDTTDFEAQKIAELEDTDNTDQIFGEVTFGETELASGIFPISLKLLRDTGYDVMADFNKALGESFGRGANRLLTKGAAADEPQGIEGAVQSITPMQPGQEMINEMFHSVDEAYRMSDRCFWMMNDNTVKRFKNQLVDANGRPLHKSEENASAGFTYVLEEKPVIVNTHLSDDAVIFGDFESYQIRLIGGIVISVLRELFARKRAIGLIGHTGIDGRLVDSHGLVKMTLPAAA
jgi:HK97 family phage major capsid protein